MGETLRAIYDTLAPLRLYALEQNSLLDKELESYDAAFSPLEDMLSDIRAQAFVHTSTGGSLARHEKLVGLVERPGLDLATRRSLVLYRLGVAPLDYTLAGLTASLRAAGMVASITENTAGESLSVRCEELIDTTMDLDRLLSSVTAMLPAHLEAKFDIGEMTWDLFDSYDINWDLFDATRMTWTEFDLNGHHILNKE